MIDNHELDHVASSWSTLLGASPQIGIEQTGRELWPITAGDGREYFLKRLGPWRNLPVADEARVLRWLAQSGVGVAEFMITETASLWAGEREDSYVLIPRLRNDPLAPSEVVEAEAAVGQAIAELHAALDRYPLPTHSYVEELGTALSSDLLLPPDVAAAFAPHREQLVAAFDRLPLRLVHGDLTPGNVLLQRPSRVAGFIDFDHLPQAPRIWDVGRYLSRRMRSRWQAGNSGSDARLASIAPLLRGYQCVAELTPEELEVLPGLMMAANLIEVSYARKIAAGLLERRMLPDHLEVLADTTETVRWQLAHLDELRDAVASSGV